LKLRFAAMLIVAVSLVLSAAAVAETIQGTVQNLTTGKPAAGAEVVLLSLAQGMNETARTKTNASGAFRFEVPDPGGPHLVRVNHQDVNYFKMVPPGTSAAEIKVYDSAKKLDAISTQVEVMRVQAEAGTLQVLELYSVNNRSTPPRTLAGDHTYEIALPEGAQLDNSAAQGPGGQPVNAPPAPVAGKKNHFQFQYPLRPGETRFQIAYHLPYSGQTTIKPTILEPLEHFVAMMPKTMQFAADKPEQFQPMPDSEGTNVQVASNVKPGQAMAFKVSGTGTLSEEGEGGGEQQAQAQGPGTMRRGPGGGLGAPIEAPDPLSRYKWFILGGLAAMLVAGAFYVVTRPGTPAAAETDADEDVVREPAAKASPRPSVAPARRSGMLLEAMKEELFQLEVDRQQGKVSEAEYRKAKDALDETLRRAMARASSE
jgi:hypothetical protein